jgi:hypothetical protein
MVRFSCWMNGISLPYIHLASLVPGFIRAIQDAFEKPFKDSWHDVAKLASTPIA